MTRYLPYSSPQCVGSLASHRFYKRKSWETGPTVCRPYPGRLESLTVCRSLFTKVALSPQLVGLPIIRYEACQFLGNYF